MRPASMSWTSPPAGAFFEKSFSVSCVEWLSEYTACTISLSSAVESQVK